MTPGFAIFRCVGCGARLFPERLLCPRCHGAAFTADRVAEGVVEEISVIRHMIGQADWKPRRIANVRTDDDGPSLTVGLIDDAQIGDRVELFPEGEAPVGKRKP